MYSIQQHGRMQRGGGGGRGSELPGKNQVAIGFLGNAGNFFHAQLN